MANSNHADKSDGTGQEFSFVAHTKPLPLNAELRTQIRSQVMKDFSRRERQRKSHEVSQPSTSLSAITGHVHRFKLRPDELRPTFTQPKQRFTAGIVDISGASRMENGRHETQQRPPLLPDEALDTLNPYDSGTLLPGTMTVLQRVERLEFPTMLPPTIGGWNPEINALDPFDTLPIPSSRRLDLLIRHCELTHGHLEFLCKP